MGKNRDARRAAAHRLVKAAALQADAVSHIEFRSPKWQRSFFHALESGDNSWLLPPGARTRPATPQEQALLEAMEVEEKPKDEDAKDWVVRQYGVLKGPYLYSESLGRVQLLPASSAEGSASL